AAASSSRSCPRQAANPPTRSPPPPPGSTRSATCAIALRSLPPIPPADRRRSRATSGRSEVRCADLSSWMKLLVDRLEAGLIDVGVDLGRCDVAVAEQFLH